MHHKLIFDWLFMQIKWKISLHRKKLILNKDKNKKNKSPVLLSKYSNLPPKIIHFQLISKTYSAECLFHWH